jgi:alkylation response protein AidB-like acyl-CoA dehydrogenase
LAEAEVLSVLLERVLRKLSETGELSPESSVIKLYFSELHRRIGELAVRMEGLPGQLVADVDKAHDLNVSAAAWMYEHLRSWRYLLGAGTSEIQRNHISEGVLGLPKEPPLAASTKA